MDSVGVRELRQNASKVLDRVKAGEVVQVTERGVPVAMLVPVVADEWQALIDAGIVVPAANRRSLIGLEPVALPDGVTSEQLLQELRGDDR